MVKILTKPANLIAKVPVLAKKGIWFKLSDIPGASYISLFAFNLVDLINDYPKVGAGCYIKEGFVEWKNVVASYHLKRAQFNKATDLLAGHILEMTPEHKKRLKKYYLFAQQLMVESKKFRNLNFSKFSDTELIKRFNKLADLHRQNHLYGGILTFLPDEEQQRVSNGIMNKIKGLIKENKVKINLTLAWNIITTQRKRSFREQEEIDLLKFCIEIFKNKKLGELLKKTNDVCKTLKSRSILYKKLVFHYNKYRWITYMYLGPGYGIDFYCDRIKENILRGSKNMNKLYLEASNKHKEIVKSQKQLIEKLKPNKKDKELLLFAGEFVWLKGYRKDTFYHLFYSYEPFLCEVAKRIGIGNWQEIAFLFPWEFKKALIDRKFTEDILKQRRTRSLYYVSKKIIKFYYEKDVKKFKNSVQIENNIGFSDTLRGMIAYPGVAKGVVKIIQRPDDMKKMKQNNILVSQMTNPNLVPAMRKAAAIVTNTGGLTCHASILSRELKIPCIVGTKIATKVLKDGDLVEVDADKGVVKILKKK